MSENLAIWERLGKTDPAHTKGFSRAGGFKGTAIKPIWIVQRLTAEFGPVGVGWGMGKPSFQVVPAGDETMVYCTVVCWHTSKENEFYGVGGDKVTTKRKDGTLFHDDEAFKKAFTDAVGNAFKFVGVGADVHMGLFDDSKYVQEMNREFSPPEPEATPKKQEKLAGPIKTRAALRQACGEFVRELHSCEDEDQLTAFFEANKPLIEQVEAEAPFFWNGDGGDFLGMAKEMAVARGRVQ